MRHIKSLPPSLDSKLVPFKPLNPSNKGISGYSIVVLDTVEVVAITNELLCYGYVNMALKERNNEHRCVQTKKFCLWERQFSTSKSEDILPHAHFILNVNLCDEENILVDESKYAGWQGYKYTSLKFWIP